MAISNPSFSSLAYITYSITIGKSIKLSDFHVIQSYMPNLRTYLVSLMQISALTTQLDELRDLMKQTSDIISTLNGVIPMSATEGRTELSHLQEKMPNEDELTKKIDNSYNELSSYANDVIQELNQVSDQYDKDIQAFLSKQAFINEKPYAKFSRDEILTRIQSLPMEQSIKDWFSSNQLEKQSTRVLYCLLCSFNETSLPKTQAELNEKINEAKKIEQMLPMLPVHSKQSLSLSITPEEINKHKASMEEVHSIAKTLATNYHASSTNDDATAVIANSSSNAPSKNFEL
jgi:hypothetical protein